MNDASREPGAKCSSSRSKPACTAMPAARTKASRTDPMSLRSISRGACPCAKYRPGKAESNRHFPEATGSGELVYARDYSPADCPADCLDLEPIGGMDPAVTIS